MKALRLRGFRFDGDVAFIPLSRGLEAVIDAEDAHLVANRNWCALKSKRTFYAVNSMGGKMIYLHRMIMPGYPEIDHRDGDGLNCRKHNLRPAEHAQNSKNKRISTRNTSGFKGVFRHKQGRWQASIQVDYRTIYLGLHDTPEAAHAAYAEASARLHGEFGRPQ